MFDMISNRNGWMGKHDNLYKLVTVFKMNVISMEEMKTSIFDML